MSSNGGQRAVTLTGERREEASEEEWERSSECQRKNKLRLWLVSKKRVRKKSYALLSLDSDKGKDVSRTVW